jgi:hypothetical protein
LDDSNANGWSQKMSMILTKVSSRQVSRALELPTTLEVEDGTYKQILLF